MTDKVYRAVPSFDRAPARPAGHGGCERRETVGRVPRGGVYLHRINLIGLYIFKCTGHVERLTSDTDGVPYNIVQVYSISGSGMVEALVASGVRLQKARKAR